MMDILSTALSGLNASRMRVQTAANNVANVNTPGFRAQRAHTRSGPSGQSAVVPGISTLTEPGALKPTGNPLDLAISGPGFFQAVDGDGNTFYSRDGAFSRSPDGVLVNSQGLVLQPPAAIPPGTVGVTVGSDGTISAQMPDGENVNAGQIEIAQFSNPQGLAREGGNLLTQTGASGISQAGAPGTGGRGILISGFLETSNVDIPREMIALQNEESLFRANAAVVKTADEMNKTALDLLA